MFKELLVKYSKADPLFKLIYINLITFILVQICHTSSFLLQSALFDLVFWLGMPSDFYDLLYKPWTLISYMFTHSGFMHILFNLIWLYFSGQIFLQYFNKQKLFSLYIMGGITGGVTYLIAYNLLPVFSGQSTQLIGASAAVLAILFAVATYVPNYRVNLIFFGLIPIKYLAIASVFIDIISIPNGNAGGHIAHLGGALSGMYFIQNWKKGKDITITIDNLIDAFLNLFKKSHLKQVHKRPKTDDEFRSEKAERSIKIDAILDKIAKSGYDSLKEKEKEYLFKHSKKM